MSGEEEEFVTVTNEDVETRQDEDEAWYTKAEFQEFYIDDWEEKWEAAGRRAVADDNGPPGLVPFPSPEKEGVPRFGFGKTEARPTLETFEGSSAAPVEAALPVFGMPLPTFADKVAKSEEVEEVEGKVHVEETIVKEETGNLVWCCTKCGTPKRSLVGAHLAAKESISSQCGSKHCSHKKRNFTKKDVSKKTADKEDTSSTKAAADTKPADKADVSNPFGASSAFTSQSNITLESKTAATNVFTSTASTAPSSNPFGTPAAPGKASATSFFKDTPAAASNPFAGGFNAPTCVSDASPKKSVSNPFASSAAKETPAATGSNPFASSSDAKPAASNPFAGGFNSSTDSSPRQTYPRPFAGAASTTGSNPFAAPSAAKDTPAATGSNPFASSADAKPAASNPFAGGFNSSTDTSPKETPADNPFAGAASTTVINPFVAPKSPLRPVAEPIVTEGTQWKCSKCGEKKIMTGAHLAAKTQINTQCGSKQCSHKKRQFDRVSADAAPAEKETPAAVAPKPAPVVKETKKEEPAAKANPFASGFDVSAPVVPSNFSFQEALKTNAGTFAKPAQTGFGFPSMFTHKYACPNSHSTATAPKPFGAAAPPVVVPAATVITPTVVPAPAPSVGVSGLKVSTLPAGFKGNKVWKERTRWLCFALDDILCDHFSFSHRVLRLVLVTSERRLCLH